MIVTYNKAEIVEDEFGRKHLHLELQAFAPGMKTIIITTFPATCNFDPLELAQAATDIMPLLTSKVQRNDADR
jgi:hypothetical protein